MRFSLSTLNWMSFPEPPRIDRAIQPRTAASLENVLAAARDAGFDTVGLDALGLGARIESDGRLREVAALLADLGLGCSDVGVLRVGQSDGLAAARALARTAATVGATVCGTVVDAPLDSGVVPSLKRCAEVLADSGVRMALEFMAFAPLGTLERAISICDEVGWDRCGLLLDSWHLFHSGRPWDLIATLTADQIALVQVSDGKADIGSEEDFFVESRWGRVPPGEGSCDFPALLAAIAATGYDGFVSPEVLSLGARYSDPSECAQELMRTLRASIPH